MEYRIEPVKVSGHGLKDDFVLSPPLGYELFYRDGIRLRSMGIYSSKEAAKQAAKSHAGDNSVAFV